MTTRLSSNFLGASMLDRRVAVAPMMDWSDDVQAAALDVVLVPPRAAPWTSTMR